MDANEFVTQLDANAENFIYLYEAFRMGDLLIVVWKVEGHYSVFPHTEFYKLENGNWVLCPSVPEEIEVLV